MYFFGCKISGLCIWGGGGGSQKIPLRVMYTASTPLGCWSQQRALCRIGGEDSEGQSCQFSISNLIER